MIIISLNVYNKETGTLTTIANGSTIWQGTKAAYEAAEAAGEIPNNCGIIITDDYASADVAPTNFTLHFRKSTNGTEPIIIESTSKCQYSVKNGICTVLFSGTIRFDSSIGSLGALAVKYDENPDLPKAGGSATGCWWSDTLGVVFPVIDDTTNFNSAWFKYDKSTGAMELPASALSSSTTFSFVFNYPVA